MQIKIYAKCNDLCFTKLIDDTGHRLKEYSGYVPSIVSLDGDALDLEIDLKTGQILNWRVPSDTEIQEFIGS